MCLYCFQWIRTCTAAWSRTLWQKSVVFSSCRYDCSWPASSPVSVEPRKPTGYLCRWRCSLLASLSVSVPVFTCCALMYLLDKLWVTDKAVLHIFEKTLSPWTIYLMLLDKEKLMGICIFLCSGSQCFTLVFQELDLVISCSCLPIPQALWPGIAPLSR